MKIIKSYNEATKIISKENISLFVDFEKIPNDPSAYWINDIAGTRIGQVAEIGRFGDWAWSLKTDKVDTTSTFGIFRSKEDAAFKVYTEYLNRNKNESYYNNVITKFNKFNESVNSGVDGKIISVPITHTLTENEYVLKDNMIHEVVSVREDKTVGTVVGIWEPINGIGQSALLKNIKTLEFIFDDKSVGLDRESWYKALDSKLIDTNLVVKCLVDNNEQLASII